MQFISIVMPTYNSSKTIKHTLDSVMCQTYRHYELIIVDDFSDDFEELKAIVDGYNDSRIMLYQQERNMNGAAARNRGVSLSSYEAICFLDSDDIWYPEKLERQVKNFKSNSVVFSKTCIAYSHELDRRYFVKSQFDENKSVAENLFGELNHNLILQTSSLMVCKEIYLKCGGFDESLYRHQDFQVVFSLEDSGAEFIFLDDVLSIYVKQKSSDINKKGWSIERSDFFLKKYHVFFKQSSLENFIIVQLLGPSIKTRNIIGWFSLVRKYQLNYLLIMAKSLKYIFCRVALK
ncbi:TPA: glycosyltransferase [Vibrio parahaemolyticus]|nr:glycosyltransferase [Vibrio parahaemolyticus]